MGRRLTAQSQNKKKSADAKKRKPAKKTKVRIVGKSADKKTKKAKLDLESKLLLPTKLRTRGSTKKKPTGCYILQADSQHICSCSAMKSKEFVKIIEKVNKDIMRGEITTKGDACDYVDKLVKKYGS